VDNPHFLEKSVAKKQPLKKVEPNTHFFMRSIRNEIGRRLIKNQPFRKRLSQNHTLHFYAIVTYFLRYTYKIVKNYYIILYYIILYYIILL